MKKNGDMRQELAQLGGGAHALAIQILGNGSDASDAVQDAFAAVLPSGQRQIILLRDYLDLPYAEIAQVLQIAPGTVMSRLHRARMALKEELEKFDEYI